MICWGDHKTCGIFSADKEDRLDCKCERDMCISDLPVEARRAAIEADLKAVKYSVYKRSDEFIGELGNMLKIKSISSDKQYNKQNKHIIDRLAQYLKELEFEVEVVKVKPEDNEKNVTNQYVIFANYYSTPIKNVVLIYGYVDVLPINEPKKWNFEPFDLTEEEGKLYGHGLTTSKGSILAWIQAIDAWYTLTEHLPINVRFVIEVNHYQNSRGLKELFSERKTFFQPVDLIIYCTNHWIAEKTPMIVGNHCGYVYFELDVSAKDAPSSSPFPSEPMSEMCRLMNTLIDPKNGVLVHDFVKHVTPVTQNDWNILSKMESGPMELKEVQNIERLPHQQSRQDYLKHRFCMPSISMHSVKSFHADSLRTLRTPDHCVTQFSAKLVSQQSLRYVIYLFQLHFHEAYRKLKCVHNAELRVIDKLAPNKETRRNPFRDAVKNAFAKVYKCNAVLPDNISIFLPILNEMLKHCTPYTVSVGVPFASIHSQPNMANENQPREMYIRNIILCLNIMFEVSLLPPSCKCGYVPDFCRIRGTRRDLDLHHLLIQQNPTISIGVNDLEAWKQNQNIFAYDDSQEEINKSEVQFGNSKVRKLD